MNYLYAAIAIAATGMVAGCGGMSPPERETPVNWVAFDASGALVRSTEDDPNAIGCQDYDQRYVLWDRSVDRPEGMSVTDADAVCRSKEQTAFETGPGTALSGAVHADDGTLADNANASVGSANVDAYQTGETFRP